MTICSHSSWNANRKPAKRKELAYKVRNEEPAILQRQPGFVDLIALRNNAGKERLLYLSFWNTREEAEHYHHNYMTGSP